MNAIGIFPGPLQPDDWGQQGNGHMREVVRALERRGVPVLPLDPASLAGFGAGPLRPAALHLNWTEALTLHYLGTRGRPERWAARLPWLAKRMAEQWLQTRLRTVRSSGAPVIYQVHDLESNWLPRSSPAHAYDQIIKRKLMQTADAWVIHESSALEAATHFARGHPAQVVRCRLGSYAGFHGIPVARAEARSRLGLPAEGLVFLWTGYCNERRNPRRILGAFRQIAALKSQLLISGVNLADFLPDSEGDDRVRLFKGLVTQEAYRDLVCAADWIIMDADHHTTSAVVRTALSYHRPVICRPFGCQRDMAEGAALWLGPLSLTDALIRAQQMTPPEYEQMAAAAAARDQERAWTSYHEDYWQLLRQLGATR